MIDEYLKHLFHPKQIWCHSNGTLVTVLGIEKEQDPSGDTKGEWLVVYYLPKGKNGRIPVMYLVRKFKTLYLSLRDLND